LQADDDFNLEGALAALEAKPPPTPAAVSAAPTPPQQSASPTPALTPREDPEHKASSKKSAAKKKKAGGGGNFQTLFWVEEPPALTSTADDAHAEALLAKCARCTTYHHACYLLALSYLLCFRKFEPKSPVLTCVRVCF
jgi:hypothetical protein